MDLYGDPEKPEQKILNDSTLNLCKKESTGKNLLHLLILNKDPT
jgi:hypothetical protein